MTVTVTWELVVFVTIMVLGVLSGIAMWRTPAVPCRDPYLVFREIGRDERARYVKIWRGSLSVQQRDLGRAMLKVGRELIRPIRDAAERMGRA
jgi:hypothetical protein